MLDWLFGKKKVSEFYHEGDGEYAQEVVGESHYQNALKQFAEQRFVTAKLVYEDTNPHDDKAIKVTILGKTVGYLSRTDARTYRRKMKAANRAAETMVVAAKIIGGKHGKYFGILLDF